MGAGTELATETEDAEEAEAAEEAEDAEVRARLVADVDEDDANLVRALGRAALAKYLDKDNCTAPPLPLLLAPTPPSSLSPSPSPLLRWRFARRLIIGTSTHTQLCTSTRALQVRPRNGLRVQTE